MSDPAVKKPPVPSPAKLREANDSLLPVRGQKADPEPREAPAKPVRARLMEVISEEDLSSANNLKQAPDQSKYKDLNFKVDELYHRRVKGAATAWGMSMKELFEAAFENWVEANGEQPRSVAEYKRVKDKRKTRSHED